MRLQGISNRFDNRYEIHGFEYEYEYASHNYQATPQTFRLSFLLSLLPSHWFCFIANLLVSHPAGYKFPVVRVYWNLWEKESRNKVSDEGGTRTTRASPNPKCKRRGAHYRWRAAAIRGD